MSAKTVAAPVRRPPRDAQEVGNTGLFRRAFSVKEVAAMVAAPYDAVLAEVNSGRLRARMIGREWRISDICLNRYLAGR